MSVCRRSGRRVLLLCGFDRIEHGVHSRVTGDVRDHLPATAMNDAHRIPDLLWSERQESSVLRVVQRIELPRAATVRRPHERCADQDPAVGNQLERPRLEPLVAFAEGDRQLIQLINEALDSRGIARAGDTDCDGRPHEQTAGGAGVPCRSDSPRAWRPRSMMLVIPAARYCRWTCSSASRGGAPVL